MRVTLLGIPALRARTDPDPRITVAAVRRAAESEDGRGALVLDGFPVSRSPVAKGEAAIGASLDLALHLQIPVTEAAVDHRLADGRG